MGIAPLKWRVIGAVIVFFGCWLICLRVQLRRINREIDRFESMETAGYFHPRRMPGQVFASLSRIVHSVGRFGRRLSPLTENRSRVILLDSGARKA